MDRVVECHLPPMDNPAPLLQPIRLPLRHQESPPLVPDSQAQESELPSQAAPTELPRAQPPTDHQVSETCYLVLPAMALTSLLEVQESTLLLPQALAQVLVPAEAAALHSLPARVATSSKPRSIDWPINYSKFYYHLHRHIIPESFHSCFISTVDLFELFAHSLPFS